MSKLFSFDVESDGLYGPAFAVAAVVRENGVTTDTFQGQITLDKLTDAWVKVNVIHIIKDIPMYDSAEDLRNAFWEFYKKHSDAKIICDVPYPVESKFLIDCINDDPERIELSPYPIIDVASVLLAKNYDPDIDRVRMVHLEGYIRKHHPLDDAIVSAICFEFAMRNC